MSDFRTESKANSRFPGLTRTGSRTLGTHRAETDSDLPKRDAAIILTVTALIVGLIVLFLVTAPTFARPTTEGESHAASYPTFTESLPTIPQENDHASRD